MFQVVSCSVLTHTSSKVYTKNLRVYNVVTLIKEMPSNVIKMHPLSQTHSNQKMQGKMKTKKINTQYQRKDGSVPLVLYVYTCMCTYITFITYHRTHPLKLYNSVFLGIHKVMKPSSFITSQANTSCFSLSFPFSCTRQTLTYFLICRCAHLGISYQQK